MTQTSQPGQDMLARLSALIDSRKPANGGDPASIQFCESVGLDYVSCSPYRVPIARLAAAQAAIGEREKDR